ncbi:MAG: hypothetical protein ACRBFS_16380 [Aureispira sp.]
MIHLSYTSYLKCTFVLLLSIVKTLTAQEQLSPPMDWLYRIEKAAAIKLVTAAQGKNYIIGTQSDATKAFTTFYTPYKKKTSTTSQKLPFSAPPSSCQLFLHCLDEHGKTLWQQSWLSSDKNNLAIQALAVDQGNNVHLMGTFKGQVNFDPSLTPTGLHKTTKGDSLLYLLQLHPEGGLINITIYPSTLLQSKGTVISLQLDYQQDYLYLLQNDGTYSKLTTNGEVVWSKKVLGNNHYNEFTLEPSNIAVDRKNNLYILRYSDYHAEEGQTNDNVFPVPSSILKIAPTGEKIWESSIHTNSKTSFVVNEKGQIYWWSSLLNTRWTGTEQHFKVYLQATLLLGKIDVDGQELWQKRFLTEDGAKASDLTLVNEEELYATYTKRTYLKQFGAQLDTTLITQKPISKNIKVFDLEGQERWQYTFPFQQIEQDQLKLHYDKTSKKLLFWGAVAPTSDLDVHPQRKFPAGRSSSAQVFQWSPVLPRP